jgi:hypothetical protein
MNKWSFWGEVAMGVVIMCLLVLVTIVDVNLEGLL